MTIQKILTYMMDAVIERKESSGIKERYRDMNQLLQEQYERLGISPEVSAFGEKIEASLKQRFEEIDARAEYNQLKVLKAMQDNRVSAECFNTTSGYGYNDLGRDTLEKVYASCFRRGGCAGASADHVRHPRAGAGSDVQSARRAMNCYPRSASHTIRWRRSSASGLPRDRSPSTALPTVRWICLRTESLTMKASAPPSTSARILSPSSVPRDMRPRKTLSVERIGELIAFIKDIKPDVICMVDNCYGEFVEEREPIEVGADMIVGSLIKNPGGGLAPIGGYIVGKKECVENAAYRLTSPGLGKEVGASLGILQSFYQGLFLAPTVVSGALKGAIFAANIYEKLGFDVVPDGSESRHDIIQAISFAQSGRR